MIYFDHAATSIQKPKQVIEAVTKAMQTMGNSGRSIHAGAMDASRIIYETREKIAAFVGCKQARNVIFTCNATESLNIAVFGILEPGDHVIATELEHNSVLRPLYEMRSRGVEVDFVPADRLGRIDLTVMEQMITEKTKGIVCTHASNLTGNSVDIAKIGAMAHRHNLLFIVDASQTAGRFPIDMEQMHIDILCFTGHKAMLGPQGTGVLCIGEQISIKPFKMGGTGVQTYLTGQPMAYPTRLEAGTLNGHGIAGLSAAVDFLNEIGIDTLRRKEQELMRYFYEQVIQIPGIVVYGDFSGERAPIVSLNFKDMSSGELADYLWEEYEIATRAGAHCAPLMHKALGTIEQGAVRFSFGYENTREEVDTALLALRRLV